MDLEQRIAENIKRLRLAAGLSQRGLAERVHIQPEYVSKIERRKRGCNFRMLTAIAGALGASAIELMLPNLGTGTDEERVTHLVTIARHLPAEKLDILMRLAGMLLPDVPTTTDS